MGGGRREDCGVTGRGKSIRLDFRYRGVRCRETLKLEPTKANLKYVAALRGDILRKIAKGEFRYADFFPDSPRAGLFGSGRAGNLLVKDALDDWIRGHRQDVSLATLHEYRKTIRKHLIPAFGDIRLRLLTKAAIKEWRASLEVSPKTANNILTPLRQMLRDAHEDDLIDKNPSATIRNLKVVTEEPDPFTPSEMKAILAQLDGQVLNLYQFLFFAGLRTSEVIALKWEDIGTDHIRVRRAKVRGIIKEPKTASGTRKVKLLQPALEALTRQKAHTYLQGEEVFHNPLTGRAWASDKAMREAHWGHALKRAGVPYRVPYQCRHTYASMMLSSGENAMWVAKQMGHANVQVLFNRYGRWIQDVDPDAGDRISEVWKEAK